MPLLLLILTQFGQAQQDNTDDDDDSDTARYAWLTVRFDASGAANADLNLYEAPHDGNAVRNALGQMLHCPSAQFQKSSTPRPQVSARWSAAQREAYERYWDNYEQGHFVGHCAAALPRKAFLVAGRLDARPLLDALRRESFDGLVLYISVPANVYQSHNQQYLWNFSEPGSSRFRYRLPASDAGVANIDLAYGFRNQDVGRAAGAVLGFVLVPFSIVLWMRRAALRLGKDDRVAAWFSYVRTSNWMMNGAVIGWFTVGVRIQPSLWSLADFAFQGWKAILLSLLIVVTPAWGLYLVCLVVSYPVYVQVRGLEWSRRDYLVEQLVSLGAVLVPLTLFMVGINFSFTKLALALPLFGAAALSRIFLATWKTRIVGEFPQALTTGELRDRVFAMATKAGVKVRQVYVLPAGKSQMANAFASRNNLVMFTDYLLRRLSRREVNAIAAHELTHLRHRHPLKLLIAYIAVFVAPAFSSELLTGSFRLLRPVLAKFHWLSLIQLQNGLRRFENWGLHDLMVLMIGIALLLLLSRCFEHTADLGAAKLSGDPEATVTGLLKLARVSLMPIQWSKRTERWMTHPSMVRRVQRIAAHTDLSRQRLEEILNSFSTLAESTAEANDEADRYPIPDVTEKGRAIPSTLVQQRVRRNLGILILMHVVPPALIVVAAEKFAWLAGWHSLALVFGLALTIGLYLFTSHCLTVIGRTDVRRRLLAKFLTEPGTEAQPTAVGFAPGENPRYYQSSFDWDTGLLFLDRDRLVYRGDATCFGLSPDQILAVELGAGQPGWWRTQRVYVTWRDPETDRGGTFTLDPQEPCHFWETTSQTTQLQKRLQSWKQSASQRVCDPARCSDFRVPILDAVTGLSPAEIGKRIGRHLQFFLIVIVPCGLLVNILLGIHESCYVYIAAGLIRIVELVPCWAYRDRPSTNVIRNTEAETANA
ncbi:MAG TPA: M48 family metalloprotease [Candidatus Sulfotelmatobacter sp.]|nr:M48 family metalloprotease [Candidatus Sulfotelmatobacter sp.]